MVIQNGMRKEANKRKTGKEVEENMLGKTVMYLKTSERAEAKKESEEAQDVVELEVYVNEEEVEGRTERRDTV